jgi:hypothetical protein
MASIGSKRRSGESTQVRHHGEDAAMALALLLVSIFGLAVATLLLLELLAAVPTAIGFIVLVSIVAACVMLGRAVREKLASLPQLQRGPIPIVRQLRR